MSKPREKFEYAGSVTVDAGLIQIGDPCYMFDAHDKWLKYLETSGITGMDLSTNVSHENGNPGMAVVVSSGFGDGVYDVMVKKCSETGRVKEVKIKFF